MSKLTEIRRALRDNRNVVVVGVKEVNNLLKEHEYWVHKLTYYTAPREHLFRADELQPFMLSLCPSELGIRPMDIEPFSEAYSGRRKLGFGSLNLHEEVGVKTCWEETVITDPDLTLPEGFVDNKLIVSKNDRLLRGITIRLFPTVALATEIYEGRQNVHNIWLDELAKYR